MRRKDTADRRILLVDGSSDFRVRSMQPIVSAGCECTAVRTFPEALEQLERERPLMVLVDAGMVALEGDRQFLRLKEHPAFGEVPLVVLAARDTPTELIEICWRAGVDDCILGPLRLAHVQARVAALSGEDPGAPRPHERRRARTLLLAGADEAARKRRGSLLELNGYRLVYASTEQQAAEKAAAGEAAIDLIVLAMHGEPEGDLECLRRLRAHRSFAGLPAILISKWPGPAGAEPNLIGWFEQTTPFEHLLHRANAAFNRASSSLCADERVPFFCPVEVRESAEAGQPWSSGYSHDLSPGGVFVKTLVPARPGAAVELQIHLTTTREVLDGTGVVAWANSYSRRNKLSYPVGMGVQFLGMSPKRLGRLREICQAARFELCASPQGTS